MNNRHFSGLILILLLLYGCGGGDGGSVGSVANDPVSNPEGVLLIGADSDLAVNATKLLSPTPVEPGQIKTDGLLSTRLDAVINSEATVAEVNSALESVGAKIDGMVDGNPVVVLNIPEVIDHAAAKAVAVALQANDAFLFVTETYNAVNATTPISVPARAVKRLEIADLTASRHNATSVPDWHQTARFPALIRGDVGPTGLSQSVTVVVPNEYSVGIPDIRIPDQFFLDGILVDGSSVEYGALVFNQVLGSYGYSVSGLISNTDIEQAYPDINSDLLNIASAPLGGLSYAASIIAIQHSLRNAISSTPDAKIVLNTGFTYADADFSGRSRIWRAIDALNWRSIGPGFLHVAAVGDLGNSTGAAGQADYSSPFAVSEAYRNLQDLILEDPDLEFSSDEVFSFVSLRTYLGNPSPIGNLLTVGSSQPGNLTRSDFSTPGADVRMIGEDVTTLCITSRDPCVDGVWVWSSTEVASAQIAALAAWMLNMDSTLTFNTVIEVIKHVFQNGQLNAGIVDTYAALLALDSSFTSAPIRRRILDVTNSTGLGAPDGLFDDNDIDKWVNVIFPDFEDDLPFDLNGDGHIGGDTTAWFDLNIDTLPVYNTDIASATRNFNEMTVTDLDVLCFYAYSSLFTGDAARRDELLGGECAPLAAGNIAIELSFTPSVMSGTSTMLTIRAGIRLGDAAIEYQAGIDIRTQEQRGETVTGTTNATGYFTVFMTPDIDAGLYSTLVTATKDDKTTTDVAILTVNSSNTDVGAFAYWIPPGKLMKRDTDGSITELESTVVNIDSMRWSQSGDKIVFTGLNENSNVDIFTVSPDGSNLTNITSDDTISERSPNWAPGGTRFAYTSSSTDPFFKIETLVINSDGSGKTALPGVLGSPPAPITSDLPNGFWSPDGNRILIKTAVGGIPGVGVYDLLDDSETLIAPSFVDFKTIALLNFEWSSDGNKIVFLSNQDNFLTGGALDIYTVNADGSNMLRLTTSSGIQNSRPAWSPDGSMIAYYSDSADSTIPPALMLVNADGSGQRVLVQGASVPEWSPRWSPDSTRITFGRVETTVVGGVVVPPIISGDVNLINVDGSGLINLLSGTTDKVTFRH